MQAKAAEVPAALPAMDEETAAAIADTLAQVNTVLIEAANNAVSLQVAAKEARAAGDINADTLQQAADAASQQFKSVQQQILQILADNGVNVSEITFYQQKDNTFASADAASLEAIGGASAVTAVASADGDEAGSDASANASSQPTAEEIYAQLQAHILEAQKNGITQDYVTVLQPSDYTSYLLSSIPLTKELGVNYGPSGKETWYNLDMSTNVQRLNSMGYPGEYWIREDGVKMCGEYILCAASYLVHPFGSLIETSLGTAIVADTGGFAVTEPDMIDIATNWVLP